MSYLNIAIIFFIVINVIGVVLSFVLDCFERKYQKSIQDTIVNIDFRLKKLIYEVKEIKKTLDKDKNSN